MEQVDVLAPPMFEPTGERMTATDAILAGKWLGSGNVWMYRFGPDGAIEFLYQEREPNSPWMPGKLDVAAGGYYKVGEATNGESRAAGALRELAEELGLRPDPKRLQYITRRLNVSISQKGNERKTCCSIYALEYKDGDNVVFAKDAQTAIHEATAIYWISLQDLLVLHANPKVQITSKRTAFDGVVADKPITAASFCPNYDDYLFTMPAMIASIVKG